MSTLYTNTLYPLQDKVLAQLDQADLPFYLTGGTALSRCYLQHRYSDDLDFFVNSQPNFTQLAEDALHLLKDFETLVITRSQSYYSIVLNKLLKVEFVNDTGAHFGDFIKHELYGKVDNPQNILANKLTALISREEPKDIVDIWAIAQKYPINWEEIITAANSKAVGIFPPEIAQKLETFPRDLLSKIKWVDGMQPDLNVFDKQINALIEDLLKV